MIERKVYIYALWDPRDGRIRYIGKTVNLKVRLHRHKVDYGRGKITHCSTWVKGILNDGLEPLMTILKETTESAWKEEEREWIRRGRACGFDLVNMAEGGEGGSYFGRVMPEEQKKKISEKLKGRPSPGRGRKLTPEQKEQLREARKKSHTTLGRNLTPEHKAKIGAANAVTLKGRKLSEHQRERLRRLTIERWSRPGERERCAERMEQHGRNSKGQFLPKEHKDE